MTGVSGITINTGRYARYIWHFFYILVDFAFNLPHYVTSYRHHTIKKESKKEKAKNMVTKNLLQGDLNPDPPITLELIYRFSQG